MEQKPIKVAVVVGHHSYEVQPFQDMFTAMEGIQCYIQHIEQFTSNTKEVRESYDVVVFYTMRQDTPFDNAPSYEGKSFEARSELG